MDPPLTVVDIDTYKLGEEAANTLFSIIQNLGQHRKEVLLSTRIIERESTMKGEKRKKWKKKQYSISIRKSTYIR